jgi:hypothetical protein
VNCVYEFKTKATCPVDGEVIEFDVTIYSEDMIEVEDILDHVRDMTASHIMQEPFTQRLADRLNVSVTTIGTHSGVKITCSA